MLKERQATLWRLDCIGLIEAGSDIRRLYRYWGAGFACLRLCRGLWHPDMPEHIFLDARGVWLNPEGPRTPDWYISRSALAVYFGMIPTAIRRQAAERRQGQWQALLTLCHAEQPPQRR